MKVLRRATKKEFKDFLDYEMNLNDSLLYEELNNSQQFIFQFSGATAAGMIRAVNVKNMDEVVAVNAISRPGSSSMLEPYIHGKNTGQRKYPKQISSLFEETYGNILFQEQVMGVFAEIAGYDPEGTNCFVGDTKIKTDSGEKPIKDLRIGDKVYSYNEQYKLQELKEVEDVWSNGKKEILEIELADGKKIKVTPEHLFKTQRGWIPAGGLTEGDELVEFIE